MDISHANHQVMVKLLLLLGGAPRASTAVPHQWVAQRPAGAAAGGGCLVATDDSRNAERICDPMSATPPGA